MKSGLVGQSPHPWLQQSWDIRAASNFIGGGTGTGLVIGAALLAGFGGVWEPGLLLGLVCVSLGLSMVFLELGRPWRAINVLFHPQTSWMTREGVMAMPLFAAGVAALVVGWFYGRVAALPLVVVAALAAAGFLYCQANMLHGARGIPAWREPALIPVMLATGLTEGTGLLAAISVLALARGLASSLELALFALLAVRALLWLRYTAGLRARGAPTSSLRVIRRLSARFLVLGHLLPALLVAAAWLWPQAAFLAVLAGLAAAGAGWYAKLTIITRAAASRGFAIPQTPRRGRGTTQRGARPGWGGS